eukprot:RCo040888
MAFAGGSLAELLAPDDTALSMLQRVNTRPPVVGLAVLDDPQPYGVRLRLGDVVEVHGPSQAGKTQLCLTAVAHHLLPSGFRGIEVGGLGAAVAYFDLDGRFPLERLLAILETRLRDAAGPTSTQDVLARYGGRTGFEDLLRQCLAGLIVYRCTSEAQFACTLLSLTDSLQRSSG